MKIFFALLFLFLVVSFGGLGWYYEKIVLRRIAALEQEVKTLAERKPEIIKQEVIKKEVVQEKSQEELLTAAVAKVAPSVVSIVVSKDVPKLEVVYENPFGNDPFFQNFNIRIPQFRQKGTEFKKVGAGTGFLINSNGSIITNRHVVADEEATYTVLLSNGSQKVAAVIYRDPKVDFAVLKIEGKDYPYANLGDSGELKLGQSVFAIGNALGEYSNSVSVGVISGLNRTVEASGSFGQETLSGVLQTDAAINPGNSGGPLADLHGKVIGINVATVIGSHNISFSIPVNMIQSILKKVIVK
jgi:serine protease Do